MGNSKKTSIYKPKKGRRVSQKNLYKMPQKGGGFIDSVTSMFGGDPENEEGEGEAKVENEEGEGEVENEEVEVEKEEAKVEVEKEEAKVEDEKEGEVEDEKEGEGDKGMLSTVITSAKGTVDELQSAFTKPISESQDAEDNTLESFESTPEASATNKIETIESLQQENKKLLQKMNELHEKIEELQDAKISDLQGPDILSNTPGTTPDFGAEPYGDDSIGFGSSTEEQVPMDVSLEQAPMDVSPEQAPMDVSSTEEDSIGFGSSDSNNGMNFLH